MEHRTEVFVSVDVETSGPIPGEYSMLSIGACLVDAPNNTFGRTLKPLHMNADPEALAVTGFSLETLAQTGTEPIHGMFEFDIWIQSFCNESHKPVFVGLNASFDWSFVNYYFHKFLGRNPFGFSALDVKAYYMGVMGCAWEDTRSSKMMARLGSSQKASHEAVQDAVFQAELFRLTRDYR